MPKIDQLHVESVPYEYLRQLPNLKCLKLKGPTIATNDNYTLPSTLQELRLELDNSWYGIPHGLLHADHPNLVYLDLPKQYQNKHYIKATPETIVFRGYQAEVNLREGVKRLVYMNGLNVEVWQHIPTTVVELCIRDEDDEFERRTGTGTGTGTRTKTGTRTRTGTKTRRKHIQITDDDIPKSLKKLEVPGFMNVNFLTGAAWRSGLDRLFKEVEGSSIYQTYLEYAAPDQFDVQYYDSYE
jgi:hypothetical protein